MAPGYEQREGITPIRETFSEMRLRLVQDARTVGLREAHMSIVRVTDCVGLFIDRAERRMMFTGGRQEKDKTGETVSFTLAGNPDQIEIIKIQVGKAIYYCPVAEAREGDRVYKVVLTPEGTAFRARNVVLDSTPISNIDAVEIVSLPVGNDRFGLVPGLESVNLGKDENFLALEKKVKFPNGLEVVVTRELWGFDEAELNARIGSLTAEKAIAVATRRMVDEASEYEKLLRDTLATGGYLPERSGRGI